MFKVVENFVDINNYASSFQVPKKRNGQYTEEYMSFVNIWLRGLGERGDIKLLNKAFEKVYHSEQRVKIKPVNPAQVAEAYDYEQGKVSMKKARQLAYEKNRKQQGEHAGAYLEFSTQVARDQAIYDDFFPNEKRFNQKLGRYPIKGEIGKHKDFEVVNGPSQPGEVLDCADSHKKDYVTAFRCRITKSGYPNFTVCIGCVKEFLTKLS